MIYPARPLRIFGFLVALMFCLGSPARAQIVAIGASNVAGRGVSSSDAWPAQLQGMLAAKGRNVHVTNAGINGDTNAGMLARLDSAVPEGTRIVLLDRYGGGWNARRLGQGDQNAELAAIEAKLRSRHIRVIPMWWNAVLRNYLQPDHIHFTVEGHRLVAAHMLPSVASAVR
ncbi:GDSL-type esterase/lipase family protein [Bradyrhizobium mercantei]|uniref:GDSL-type esterase/lipase family protein n=1 Tax=Bradyrhizobium mercantei TaxID=1904807 RepID=UPI001FD8F782|nr:GDSL-type esterase/lipase family protein [Bradyrhizobium mercantei]